MPKPARGPARRSHAWRAVLSAGSGTTLYLSFEPHGLWWLAPLGLAGLFAVLAGLRAWAGFVHGLVAGLGLMLPLLWWAGEYVGPMGSVPLAVVEAALVGVAAAAISAVSGMPAGPLWAALLWVAGETLRAVVPFGGFPWAKVAFGQVDGVFLPLVAVGGTPLVGFAVALVGFSSVVVAHRARRRPRATGVRTWAWAGVIIPVLAGLGAGALVDASPEQGTVTVAAVQGNVPRPGLGFNAERRAVLDNHVRRTVQLAADVRAGRVPRPDVVVWPENSSDIDPYANRDAFLGIQGAARAMGVPILVGAVVGGNGPAPRNTMLLWDPEDGPVEQYAKRRLQPFGETMPLRSFFRVFTPLVERAGRFVPGDEPTVFAVGKARVAVTMCYEVIFDEVVRDSVRNGANVLAVPSNNATFGYTDMTFQQLAIDRVRAVEHGRAVVVATTSGVSAIVGPDGAVAASTGMFEPAALVRTVPLRSSPTLADRLGPAPEMLMVSAGVGALVSSVLGRRRNRSHRISSTDPVARG